MTATIQVSLNGAPIPSTLYTRSSTWRWRRTPTGPTRCCCACRSTARRPATCSTSATAPSSPTRTSAVVVTPAASPISASSTATSSRGSCTSTARPARRRSTSAAQDASWLMNVERQRAASGPGMTDGEVANAIFVELRLHARRRQHRPTTRPRTTPTAHSLFQRATDLQFLRGLARRNGKLCRVACTDTPGDRTGYFITPAVDGDPVATISLVDPATWPVDSLDFDWDVMRPSRGRREPGAARPTHSEDGTAGNRPRAGSHRWTSATPTYAGQTVDPRPDCGGGRGRTDAAHGGVLRESGLVRALPRRGRRRPARRGAACRHGRHGRRRRQPAFGQLARLERAARTSPLDTFRMRVHAGAQRRRAGARRAAGGLPARV